METVFKYLTIWLFISTLLSILTYRLFDDSKKNRDKDAELEHWFVWAILPVFLILAIVLTFKRLLQRRSPKHVWITLLILLFNDEK